MHSLRIEAMTLTNQDVEFLLKLIYLDCIYDVLSNLRPCGLFVCSHGHYKLWYAKYLRGNSLGKALFVFLGKVAAY